MHPEVHAHLDGELPRSALSREAAAELEGWEQLARGLAERRAQRAPLGLTDDVMRALPVIREPAWRRALDWLVTPRPIRIPPLAPLAATAATLVFMLWPRARETPLATPSAPVRGAPIVYVQFALT